MDNIIQTINNLPLTSDECKLLEEEIKIILKNKVARNTVNWLKHRYHINEHFDCLEHCYHAVRYNKSILFYYTDSIEDYDTYFCIYYLDVDMNNI